MPTFDFDCVLSKEPDVWVLESTKQVRQPEKDIIAFYL